MSFCMPERLLIRVGCSAPAAQPLGWVFSLKYRPDQGWRVAAMTPEESCKWAMRLMPVQPAPEQPKVRVQQLTQTEPAAAGKGAIKVAITTVSVTSPDFLPKGRPQNGQRATAPHWALSS